MTMRCILARVDGTKGDQAVLESALQVARRFRGHVDALHVRFDARDLPLVTGYGMVADLVALTERLQQTADQMAEQARRNFDAWRDANRVPLAARRAGDGDVSGRWQEIAGTESEVIVRRGRLADLIVVARPVPEFGCASQVALETALFDTSRPVLMVPDWFAAISSAARSSPGTAVPRPHRRWRWPCRSWPRRKLWRCSQRTRRSTRAKLRS